MTMNSIAVFGLGKVGSLVALMLKESGFNVKGYDKEPNTALGIPSDSLDVSDKKAVSKALSEVDAMISCLPFNLNMNLADAAAETATHYFDLTEDVPTTNHIRKLAEKAQCVMAPQCGLAPGFIGIVGAHLTKNFDTLRSIELRVGALPRHPKGLLGYAFNWSSEGVVNEYLNDCEVIHEGARKLVPAMQDIETIIIHGQPYEAFTTSGGLGTMCETYEGKVDTLNYKTMRYQGHCSLMRFFFHELLLREQREHAGEILVNAKPPVDEDVVLVHAAVEGKQNGKLMREEYVRSYMPVEIGGEMWRAISWTTAGSAVAVIEMVRDGLLPQEGFIKQEDIPLDDFLKTKTGGFYDAHSAR